jgi:MFS family permease
LSQLSAEFQLTDTQLGWINALALFGFPVATILGGFLYNLMGAKKMMYIAFLGHLLGLLLTINANGYVTLLISSFCIGFANGCVEAACNPLITDIYHKNKTTMLNKFHVWFPGGIVIGALLSKFMTDMNMTWQMQIAAMLVPTVIYGYMIFGQNFPKTENTETSTSVNFKALLNPLYIFMLFCMTLTATTELGTSGWVDRILGNAGADPMLILAMVTGLMAVGRYFAGPVIHALNPVGVLLASAIVSSIALYLMSTATGNMVYFSAILFAIGVMYFWPTMIGFIGEYQEKTGALGMSVIGGFGMLGVGWRSPIIGGWIDKGRDTAMNSGLSGEAAELAAGQSALANIAIFPLILVIAFTALLLIMRKTNKI